MDGWVHWMIWFSTEQTYITHPFTGWIWIMLTKKVIMTHEKQSCGVNWPGGWWSQMCATWLLFKSSPPSGAITLSSMNKFQCPLLYRNVAVKLQTIWKEDVKIKEKYRLTLVLIVMTFLSMKITISSSRKQIILEHKKKRFSVALLLCHLLLPVAVSRRILAIVAVAGTEEQSRKLDMSTKQINNHHTGNITLSNVLWNEYEHSQRCKVARRVGIMKQHTYTHKKRAERKLRCRVEWLST